MKLDFKFGFQTTQKSFCFGLWIEYLKKILLSFKNQ